MAVKIESHLEPAVAYHIIDGSKTFEYGIDAKSAVNRFPGEWSHEPWSLADRNAARADAGDEVVEITPEEQEAIDAHARAVEEANERLAAFREKKAAEKAEADQVAADEALVKSSPPVPEPKPKPKPPSAAERRRLAARTDEEIAEDKRKADLGLT